MRVDLPLDRKTVENEEWATGPPGLRVAGPPGRREPWAAGRRAAGPWRVVGRGPLGRGPAFSKTRRYVTFSRCHITRVTPYLTWYLFKCFKRFQF